MQISLDCGLVSGPALHPQKMVPAIATILSLTDTELDEIYRSNRQWRK